MSITQLITLLILLGGLALFTIQNLAPTLPLNFLGNQLPSLPLSVWILIGVVAGILTYGIIANLFNVYNTTLKTSTAFRPSAKPPVEPSPRSDWVDESSSTFEPPPASVYTAYNSAHDSEPEPTRNSRSDDDWETEVKPFNPSWDAEDRTEERTRTPQSPSNSNPDVSDDEDWIDQPIGSKPQIYETEQKPKTESWSGSSYSYGYRDSQTTGVGKVETIYDADYRIITPPPPNTRIQDDIAPPNSTSNPDDEDWGLDEDDMDEPNPR